LNRLPLEMWRRGRRDAGEYLFRKNALKHVHPGFAEETEHPPLGVSLDHLLN